MKNRVFVVAMILLLGLGLSSCGKNSHSVSSGDQALSAKESSSDEAAKQDDETADKDASSDDTSSTGAEKLSPQLGSIAVSVSPYHSDPIVSEQLARDVFSISLQGVSYILPCPVQELLEQGWQPSRFSGQDRMLEPYEGLGNIFLHDKSDDNLRITIDVVNLSSEDCLWSEAYLTGVTVETGVDMKCNAGFGMDTPFDDMLSLVGANTSHSLSEYRHTAQVHLYVGDEADNVSAGYIRYESMPGSKELTQLSIALSLVDGNPLLSL